MFNFLPAVLDIDDGVITISRVPNRVMRLDLQRLYKTSRLSKHMFHESSSNSIVFYEFFALELMFSIETLIENGNHRTSVRKLQQIIELLKEETWIKKTEQTFKSILNYGKLDLFKYKPLDHQQSYFEKFDETVPKYNLKGSLLAAEPGTGKTMATLALSECLEVDYIIVVCPNNAVETVWVESVAGPSRLYKDAQSVWFYNSGKPYHGEKILVVHYEAIGKLSSLTSRFRGKKTSVILDESHNLNELGSLRTSLFLEVCQDLDTYVLYATGTPIKALAYETIPLLRAIDPLFTEDVEKLFRKIYAGEATALADVLGRRLNIISHKVSKSVLKLQEPVIEEIKVTAKNGELYTLPVIAKEMEAYVITRKKEILELMPQYKQVYADYVSYCENILTSGTSFNSKYIQEIKFEFETYRSRIKFIQHSHDHGNIYAASAEIKLCSKFEKEFIIPNLKTKDDKEKFKEAAVCVKYYTLKIKGECLGRVLGRKRIDAYVELVSSIPFEDIIETTEKKTLIFTSFIEVVNKCNTELKELGYKPLLMHGEFTGDLKGTVERFKNNEEDNPLIATYQALSTAVPLIMADTIIAVNPPYRDYIIKQAIARINRLGTTGGTRVFNITLDTGTVPNICDRMLDIVKWSKDQSNKVLNLNDDVEIEDINISLESIYGADPSHIELLKPVKSLLTDW